MERQQQKAKEMKTAEIRRVSELCQQQMLREQEAIRERNAAFLKQSEDRKYALARAKERRSLLHVSVTPPGLGTGRELV